MSAITFAGAVLALHRNDGYPGDIDGGGLQELALAHGLLEPRQVQEPCGEHCPCAEVGSFPLECYFTTDAGRAAIAASKEEPQRPPAPRRAFRLTLQLDADTRHDLASALINMAHQIEREQLSTGVSGGCSSGAIYELLHDETQTSARYFEQIGEWLSAIREHDTEETK